MLNSSIMILKIKFSNIFLTCDSLHEIKVLIAVHYSVFNLSAIITVWENLHSIFQKANVVVG